MNWNHCNRAYPLFFDSPGAVLPYWRSNEEEALKGESVFNNVKPWLPQSGGTKQNLQSHSLDEKAPPSSPPPWGGINSPQSNLQQISQTNLQPIII